MAYTEEHEPGKWSGYIWFFERETKVPGPSYSILYINLLYTGTKDEAQFALTVLDNLVDDDVLIARTMN